MIVPHIREKGVDAMVYFVVQTYARGTGRAAVEDLARGADPAVAAWATKVLATTPNGSASREGAR